MQAKEENNLKPPSATFPISPRQQIGGMRLQVDGKVVPLRDETILWGWFRSVERWDENCMEEMNSMEEMVEVGRVLKRFLVMGCIIDLNHLSQILY